MIVAIIDYGSGNVFSVTSALKRLGVEAIITSDATIIKSADAVIFPGVGHAKSAMEQLKVKTELKGEGIYKSNTLFCLVHENDVYFNPGRYHHFYHMDKTIPTKGIF